MAHHVWLLTRAAQLSLLLVLVALTSSCTIAKVGGGLMIEAMFPMTHLLVPFDAGTKGAVTELELRVPKQALYRFRLKYHYRSDDTTEAERVLKLVRGAYLSGPGGDGLMVPVRVSVWNEGQEPPKSAYDAVLTRQQFEGAGGTDVPGYNGADTQFTNAYAVLDPGRYRVRVEALEDIPALRGNPD